MTVDSRYEILTKANSEGLRYSFNLESLGDEAMEVYVTENGVRTEVPYGFNDGTDTLRVYFEYENHLDPIKKRGAAVLSRALTASESLSIERRTPITQEIDFSVKEILDPNQIEYALDKICFIEQEIEGNFCDCRGTTFPGGDSDPGGGDDPEESEELFLQCQPFACDALTDQDPDWQYTIFETEPAFGEVFPLDGITATGPSGTPTDFNGEHLIRTPAFLFEGITPCNFVPGFVLAVSSGGQYIATDPAARVASAIVAGTSNSDQPDGTYQQVQIDADLLDPNVTPTTTTQSFRCGLVDVGGGNYAAFVSGGTIAFEVDTLGGGTSTTYNSPDYLDITDVPGVEFVFSRFEWEFLGTGVGNPLFSPTVQYFQLRFRFRFDVTNVNGTTITIADTCRFSVRPDNDASTYIENETFEFVVMDGAFPNGEKNVAAIKVGEAVDYGNFAAEYLAWLRNRSAYTPPSNCP